MSHHRTCCCNVVNCTVCIEEFRYPEVTISGVDEAALTPDYREFGLGHFNFTIGGSINGIYELRGLETYNPIVFGNEYRRCAFYSLSPVFSLQRRNDGERIGPRPERERFPVCERCDYNLYLTFDITEIRIHLMPTSFSLFVYQANEFASAGLWGNESCTAEIQIDPAQVARRLIGDTSVRDPYPTEWSWLDSFGNRRTDGTDLNRPSGSWRFGRVWKTLELQGSGTPVVDVGSDLVVSCPEGGSRFNVTLVYGRSGWRTTSPISPHLSVEGGLWNFVMRGRPPEPSAAQSEALRGREAICDDCDEHNGQMCDYHGPNGKPAFECAECYRNKLLNPTTTCPLGKWARLSTGG